MENRKINIDRKPLTSEQINAKQNFNQVLNSARIAIKPFYKQGWFTATIAGVSVIVGIVALMTVLKNDQENSTSAQTTTQSQSPKSEIAEIPIYDEDTPCVNPPLKSLNIPYSTYKIDASYGGNIIHPNGTEINISESAFFNENGEEIVGDIEIEYREFHDQIDIFLSGIPMDYDSSGTQRTFESAGMFEIIAKQNGEMISLDNNKPIEVKMASNYLGEQYNQYFLDEESGQWKYIGNDVIELQIPEDIAVENSNYDYESTIEHKEDQEKIELAKEEVNTAETIYNSEANKTKAFIKKNAPNTPSVYNEDNYHFDLSVERSEFPELFIYEGVQFEVSPNDNSFTEDVYDIEWNDAKLEAIANSNNYNLTFSNDNDKRTFEVYPVLKGSDLTVATSEYNRRFGAYSKLLTKRKATESKAKSDYDLALKNYKNIQNQAVSRRLTAILSNSRTTDKVGARNTAANLSRVFQVVSLGIHNSDKPILLRPPSGNKIMASFVDQNNKLVKLPKVSLIEHNRNANFTYTFNQYPTFKYNPKEKNTIVGVTTKGMLAVVEKEQFISIPKRVDQHQFKVRLLDPTKLTVEKLKGII